MKVNGSYKRVESSTKGYELDGVLTQLFGAGAFVWLFVNKETKDFFATNEEPILVPIGLTLFSAGQVGVSSAIRRE